MQSASTASPFVASSPLLVCSRRRPRCSGGGAAFVDAASGLRGSPSPVTARGGGPLPAVPAEDLPASPAGDQQPGGDVRMRLRWNAGEERSSAAAGSESNDGLEQFEYMVVAPGARISYRSAAKNKKKPPPRVAATSLAEWEQRIYRQRAAEDQQQEEESYRAAAVKNGASSPASGGPANATGSGGNDADGESRPRRDTVFHDGGNIPLQDKFGLLLSLCSVLVSVQLFIPRVL